MSVDIFIKTQFRGNPRGCGKAAAVLEYKGHLSNIVTVQEADGTRNALALKACIAALKKMVKPSDVCIHCENTYIKNALYNGWISKWKAAGWKKAGGKELANAVEWKQFYMLSKIHRTKIEGYDGEHQEILDEALKEE